MGLANCCAWTVLPLQPQGPRQTKVQNRLWLGSVVKPVASLPMLKTVYQIIEDIKELLVIAKSKTLQIKTGKVIWCRGWNFYKYSENMKMRLSISLVSVVSSYSIKASQLQE